MITQILILFLMIDAALIASGLIRHKNMWQFICLYWVILTIKNLIDCIGGIL